MRANNIRKIPEASFVSREDIRKEVPHGSVYVLDFLVDDSPRRDAGWERLCTPERGLLGYQLGGIINIDHHAEAPEFRKWVSTTHLALLHPVVDAPVVIHHKDCDSLLSALLLTGELDRRDERWGKAALCADHTGEPDDIADLLQSIEDEGSPRSLDFQLEQLDNWLEGRPLAPVALRLLDKRRAEREQAKKLPFQPVGRSGVWWVQLAEKVESALAVSACPQAQVICMASPLGPGKWEVKVRAGLHFPPGRSLRELDLPDFGGRWNAGSTKRSGGTALAPADYAALVAARLDTLFRQA